jgi:hypothetical protein
MPGYPPLNAFSDFAIAGPGKIEVFQELSKLIVVHSFKLKPAIAGIQGNKYRNRLWGYCRNGVLG